MGELSWIGAIIVGGFAGWIASMIMKVRTGILLNIVIGIVGAVGLDFILVKLFQAYPEQNWFGQLIVGIVGACILIAILKAVTGNPRR